MKNTPIYYLGLYKKDIRNARDSEYLERAVERAIGAAWAFSDIGVITWDEACVWVDLFNAAWSARRLEVTA